MIRSDLAAEKFIGQSEAIIAVEEYGSGIIHDTYLVRLAAGSGCFILQRINTQVFQEPERIMHNLHRVCTHISGLQKYADLRAEQGWEMVQIIPARDKQDFYIDPDGGFWRALSFINNAHPLEKIVDLNHAGEAGRALGIFHLLTHNLDSSLLHDTLPGFHNIEFYLDKYDRELAAGNRREIHEPEKFCRQFIAQRRDWAPVLEDAKRRGKLALRIMHGDPKINNVMLDNKTGRAVSIIDLDTVMPGPVQYDIGDCLRSCCSVHGEEPDNPDAADFDLERCRAALAGYMAAAHEFLVPRDFDFLFDAIRLLPFELGLRFYTDYLAGNVYFKSSYPGQNLARAMVQFRLVESIERQEKDIRLVIEEYCCV